MCAFICVYVCIIYMYTCICRCEYICVSIYMYVHVCLYVYICIHLFLLHIRR